jgi:hypothetical protein
VPADLSRILQLAKSAPAKNVFESKIGSAISYIVEKRFSPLFEKANPMLAAASLDPAFAELDFLLPAVALSTREYVESHLDGVVYDAIYESELVIAGRNAVSAPSAIDAGTRVKLVDFGGGDGENMETPEDTARRIAMREVALGRTQLRNWYKLATSPGLMDHKTVNVVEFWRTQTRARKIGV